MVRGHDLAKIKSDLKADIVILDGLPFAMLQGPYIESKYNKTAFSELTLPMVMKTLQDDMRSLAASGVKKFYFTDMRLREKEYGKTIAETLGIV